MGISSPCHGAASQPLSTEVVWSRGQDRLDGACQSAVLRAMGRGLSVPVLPGSGLTHSKTQGVLGCGVGRYSGVGAACCQKAGAISVFPQMPAGVGRKGRDEKKRFVRASQE